MRILYFVADSGDVLPSRKAYKKARHKRYMRRNHTHFMRTFNK